MDPTRIFPALCYIVAQQKGSCHDRQFCRARPHRRADQERSRRRTEDNGLTVSDAFRLMMVKIAKEKALPFEPLVPNEETIEAMKAARRGELTTAGAPGKLLPSLNADC
jgi:addiction module RelB/DinJ family antitoxin